LQISKNISELIIDKFELYVDVSVADISYRDFIGSEEWERIRLEAISHKNGVCQGCGYNPPDKNFLELHIMSGEKEKPETYKFSLLCKTCHTLQHIDVASEKEWIKLCNSIYDQKKIIYICRSGKSKLIDKINCGEIMVLKQNPLEYSKSLSKDIFNKRKKIKAVFGKNFPENRLK
jgi:hypothetical protein